MGDPYKDTREQFTRNILSSDIPGWAHQDWKDLVSKLKTLQEKLAYHDAMKPNLQQTYMTPAASKNRVYFMWDFVGRTIGILYSQTDPRIRGEGVTKKEREAWLDASGRAKFSGLLILDANPGMLNKMTEAAYPDQAGQHPEFGEEIMALARDL